MLVHGALCLESPRPPSYSEIYQKDWTQHMVILISKIYYGDVIRIYSRSYGEKTQVKSEESHLQVPPYFLPSMRSHTAYTATSSNANMATSTMFLPREAHRRLSDQYFYCALVIYVPAAWHVSKFQTSRRNSQVLSINHIVCTNSLDVASHLYQLGNKVPRHQQRSTLQAGLNKDNSLRPALLAF